MGSDSSVDAAFSLPSIALQSIPDLSDFIPDLPTLSNPIDESPYYHPSPSFYISSSDAILRQILFDLSCSPSSSSSATSPLLAYHRAGPRRQIRFDPATVRAAIVTCGGLCPGLNTVIRELVVALWDLYGVRQIFGVQAGLRGFYSGETVELNPRIVHDWHLRGGTSLATSRGGFDLDKIIGGMEEKGFNQVRLVELFLGGESTATSRAWLFLWEGKALLAVEMELSA